MIEIKGKYNEAKIFTDVVASPSASSGWPMKKRPRSRKRDYGHHYRNHFGYGSFRARLYPGTALT